MTFLVVFVGLLVERFFDWSHLRHWSWAADFQRFVIRQFKQPSAYVNLAFSVVPILLAVWLVNHLLHGWMYGFPSLVFKVVVLLYAFGPQNFWADAFACINAISQGDQAAASARLKSAFGIAHSKTAQGLHRELLNDIFIAANRRVCAVVFWYVLLGPVGAVAYRLVAVEVDQALSQPAQTVLSILDWLPVRIITVFFALGGQFTHVLNIWRKKVSLGLYGSDEMMSDCGMAALGIEGDTELPDDCKVERAAVSLIDRSLIIALVVLALVVLV